LAAIAGVKSPAGIDGISVLPALLGQRLTGHTYLYWEFHEGQYAQAVRWGRWKAVRKVASEIELYDLQTDVSETHDVAPAHPDVVSRVAEIMKQAHTESEFWPVLPTSPNRPS